jgi:chromosomal replication initiation ATPase DnaA
MSDFEIFDFINSIEKETGVDIRIKNRERRYVYSRVAFFKILRTNNPKMPLSKIGSFVNMDHTSVIHSLKLYESLKNYDDFKEIVTRIKSVKTRKYNSGIIFCNPIHYPYVKN